MSRSRRKRKRHTRAQWMVFGECDCWLCTPAAQKRRKLLDRARAGDER